MRSVRPSEGRSTWVIVASLEHARRGVEAGFVMANHGKKAPLARMSLGDAVLIYSPKDRFPDGEPLKALTIVGRVTGEEPEPSPVIPDGFCRRAELVELDRFISLEDLREHLPTGRLGFGCFELDAEDAQAIWDLVELQDG